jgi:hypothetical protein
MTNTTRPTIAADHPFWHFAAMLDATTLPEPAPGTLADLGEERLAKLALLVVDPSRLLKPQFMKAPKEPKAPTDRTHGGRAESDATLMAFIQEAVKANPSVRPFGLARMLKEQGSPATERPRGGRHHCRPPLGGT